MQILKLGGSVITKKHGYMEADELNISRLAQMIAFVWKKGVKDIVIIHGAGSFGHAPVLAHGINEGVKTDRERLGYADTHAACVYLSSMIVEELIKNEVPAISIPPTAIIRQRNRRIAKFDSQVIYDYLKKGFLPILHGDMVLDDRMGGSVCSGDQIISILGKQAKRIIMGSNVDGVLVEGKVVPKIDRKNIKDIMKHLKSSGAPDVTGGMEGKFNEIMKLKAPVYIVNAGKADRVELLLTGRKTICTEIRL
ncbi:MAG: isopentenyl phosphate kinase [Candidatus Micrarchaeia archaeon]